jgi:hypothetical protein
MIKPDEIEFYRRLRQVAPEPYKGPGRLAVLAIADEIGLHSKRAEALMEKWIGRRYMECGVSAIQAWFMPAAPPHLG